MDHQRLLILFVLVSQKIANCFSCRDIKCSAVQFLSVTLKLKLLALLALGCVLADLPYGSFLLLLSVMLLEIVRDASRRIEVWDFFCAGVLILF